MASISTRISTSSKKGPRTKTYRVQYIRLSSDGTQTKTSKSFKTRSEAEEFRARAALAEKQVGGLPDGKKALWNDENVAFAIEKCQSLSLNVAINLAVGCTLRMGEITGLTWDNVYVTEESITNATSKIVIEKELARANMESLKNLRLQGEGDIQVIAPVFPTTDRKTTLVLKKPKTDSSVREIWVSATLAHLLLELKKERDIQRQRLGSEYFDGNFVICHENGRPCEGNYIRKKFYKLIADAGLPKVDFHSLRHYSVTKKLQLTGGDIKAVQGDSGHAVSKMVTDRYAHISDERRQHTAELFEAGFYTALFGKDSDVQVEALYNSIKGNSVLVEALLQRIQTDKSKKIAKNE